ncbi:MAG: hypothetical protein HY033_03250 [Ignavibacteriae bacterium]|nr:hypothetical protein [Ignavibacteria bacterium]MBI3363905.1 hypothetical protein [Ignavibacteriota bacterium]
MLTFAGSVFAQTQTPQVDAREKNQQERIKEGVKSGELTGGETRRLEAEQGKIKADEMNAKADGKVTPAERRHIKREQNRASRHIYKKKHNARERGN